MQITQTAEQTMLILSDYAKTWIGFSEDVFVHSVPTFFTVILIRITIAKRLSKFSCLPPQPQHAAQ